MASTTSSAPPPTGDGDSPQVNCVSNDLSGMSQAEKLEHAKNLQESLEAQQKYIEDLEDQTIRFDSSTFEEKKTPHFRRLKRCKIVLDDSLKITRIMMHRCEDCTIHVKARVLTSTLEIWESKKVTVDVRAPLKTIQADESQDVHVRYHRTEHFGAVVQAGMQRFTLELAEEAVQQEVGLTAITEKYPNCNPETDQFYTRWINEELLIEKIIRTDDGFPTTHRELKEQSNGEEVPDEEQFALQRAMKKKEDGNTAFRAGHVQQAIVCYSEALMLKDDMPLVLSNRAQCFLKLGEYEKALADSSRVVELEPELVKGWFRKGLSLSGLERHQEAVDAFEKALKLAPNDTNIQASVKVSAYKAAKQARDGTK